MGAPKKIRISHIVFNKIKTLPLLQSDVTCRSIAESNQFLTKVQDSLAEEDKRTVNFYYLL